jgi:DNA-binding response OmpR family regulator
MPKGKRILCIDDEEHCEIITHLLKETGENFVVTNAASPDKALDLIERQSFDLFILESRLPGISGVELCKIIRNKYSKTPVMFFSGMARPVDRSMALAAGANAYLVKPDGLDSLGDTVQKLLKKNPPLSNKPKEHKTEH